MYLWSYFIEQLLLIKYENTKHFYVLGNTFEKCEQTLFLLGYAYVGITSRQQRLGFLSFLNTYANDNNHLSISTHDKYLCILSTAT